LLSFATTTILLLGLTFYCLFDKKKITAHSLGRPSRSDFVQSEITEMGRRAHEYLLQHLTKNVSIQKYKKEMLYYEHQMNVEAAEPSENRVLEST